MQTIRIKTPAGYIIVEPKGAIDEYPGCYISFSKDGSISHSEMVACVEYNTADSDGTINTEIYKAGQDKPIDIFRWQAEEADRETKDNPAVQTGTIMPTETAPAGFKA